MIIKNVDTNDAVVLYSNNNNDNNSMWVRGVQSIRTLVTLYRMTTTEIITTTFGPCGSWIFTRQLDGSDCQRGYYNAAVDPGKCNSRHKVTYTYNVILETSIIHVFFVSIWYLPTLHENIENKHWNRTNDFIFPVNLILWRYEIIIDFFF